jgi:hypothetical protein
MRKIVLSLLGLVLVCAASAQFSVGVYGNYSKYAGDLSKGTMGIGVRAAYQKERTGGMFSFTNGFAITDKGTITLTHNTNGTSKEVAAEGTLTFKTITLMGLRTLIGDEESTGSLYGGFGASFVLANYKEKITESYDNNYTAPDMVTDNQNGLTINALIGGQYKLGKPAIFAEGAFAFPANTVNNMYVENVIPAHLLVNVGVRITLGGDE